MSRDKRRKQANGLSRRKFLGLMGMLAGSAALPGGIMMKETFSRRWWPVQRPPAGVLRTRDFGRFERVISPGGGSTSGTLGATHMLVQSVAGLAAMGVKAGITDEMVWISINSPDYALWYDGIVVRLGLEERGTFTPWELIERFLGQGMIQGYILYSYDYSEGDLYTNRRDMDRSVNVATSLAGLLGGILIEEGQEEQAKALGLEMLLDARGKNMKWCFDTYKDQFNRRMICTQDPKVPHNRAMAIAHRTLTAYGTSVPVPEMMAWLDPLSPVLGWNSGGEFDFTVLPTQYGHFNTATNWCLNLPLLSAGTETNTVKQIGGADPAAIDGDDTRHAMSFVMSDGDNVQWLMGNFCKSADYWGNVDHGAFPFGWTTCTPNLMQLCPETVDFLAETRPDQTTVISDAGGYYYPDRLAEDREDVPRAEVLAEHARQVGAYMNEAGLNVLWFICHNLQSAGAFEAYETYAREIDGLLGMLAIQYTPYEGGGGKIFWTEDANGLHVPIVTARYSLWLNAGTGKRADTPGAIAEVVNESVARAERQEKKTFEWAIVHAWSRFERDGETARGLNAAAWCIEALDPVIKVVSPEELLWRIRMEHYPEETRGLIKKFAASR